MSAQDVEAPEREPDAWLWLDGDGKPLTCALERIPYNDETYYRVALYRDPQPDPEREAAVWLERDDLDGGFVADYLPLPGVVAQGETEAEALAALAEVIAALAAHQEGETNG